MRFRTFLKSGIEVLHLGMQHAESNAWPAEHWRANPGRWRLFTPGIDRYLSEALSEKSFGPSIDTFLLVLEVADFAAWGPGPAFSGPEGWTSYSPKSRELRSVCKLDWQAIQSMTARQQLEAFSLAAAEAIECVSRAKRRPKEFDSSGCAVEVVHLLRSAKVSELSRAAWASQTEG
jgi:hypothetical protein